MSQDYSYSGVGKFWVGVVGGKLRQVGNSEKLDISVEEDVKKLPDNMAQGGGIRNRYSRISGVTVDVNLTDISPENLALAVFGSTSLIEAGTVTDEAHTAYIGGLIRFARINASAVVIKSADGLTTYVAGADYELSAAGAIPLGSGAIVDDSAVKASYSYAAQDVIEAITSSGKELYAVFDGLNEALSGKPVVVDIWRLKFGPAKGLSLIGGDYSKLELKGEALSDSTKGAGLSRYFRTTM